MRPILTIPPCDLDLLFLLFFVIPFHKISIYFSGFLTFEKQYEQMLTIPPCDLDLLFFNCSLSYHFTKYLFNFQDFLHSKNEMRPVLTIPPCDLDPLLGLFFVSLRKENGDDYEPSYLRNISSILVRYFRLNKYSHCLKSEAFAGSRKRLHSKIRHLMKGKCPRSAKKRFHSTNSWCLDT